MSANVVHVSLSLISTLNSAPSLFETLYFGTLVVSKETLLAELESIMQIFIG